MAVLRRLATVVLWTIVFAVWVSTRQFAYLGAFLFVLLGATALVLTTLAVSGCRANMFRTGPFWEAAAWTTGGLGTVVFLEAVMVGPSEGLAAGATKLALSFVPSAVGCALATGGSSPWPAWFEPCRESC